MSDFEMKVLSEKEARSQFRQKRGRRSKYDPVIEALRDLRSGKALVVDGLSAGQVQGLRSRIRRDLGEDWKAQSTSTSEDEYQVLVTRDKGKK